MPLQYDEDQFLPGGPSDELTLADAPPDSPAQSSSDALNRLRDASAAAQAKKSFLGVAGGALQGLVNAPSAYEIYTGKHLARPDVKGMADAAAGGIQDPMTQQEKAYAFMKAKRENADANTLDTFKNSIKDDTTPAAKAFKLAAGVPDGMTASEAYAQGYSPAKIGEIKAKGVVELEKEMAVHKMDATERAKDRSLDRGLKKDEMDLQRFKSQGETDLGKSAALIKNAGPSADPATLVKFLVPEHHQQKAYDEIDAAQNTARNAPLILNAFDNAANNLHTADFIPGVPNADQKSLHALMGPTFKDVEGTVRQAAMDNMNNNTTPQFGDSKATLQKKREALVGYLKSKSSAPIAAGYGMNLSQFPSTTFKDRAAGGADDLKAAALAEIEKRKKTASTKTQDSGGG